MIIMMGEGGRIQLIMASMSDAMFPVFSIFLFNQIFSLNIMFGFRI